MKEIFDLPLELQVALGGGFIAYMVASTGLRRGHTAVDVLMRSLAFGLPAMFMMRAMAEKDSVVAAFFAVTTAVICAMVWRGVLSIQWERFVKGVRVHGDDGLLTAWDGLIQDRNFKVTQVNVRLKSGRELYCGQLSDYMDGPQSGLSLGNDGGVVMVVETEVDAEGNEIQRSAIKDDTWGTRLTYIPPDQIEYIDLRSV